MLLVFFIFSKKLSTDWSQAMRAIIRCKILASSLLSKNIKLMCTELIFYLLFCMGVKLGRLYWGRNVGALRRIFGPKRDEVTGEWRKLHNEELKDTYGSKNIVRVIKSRKMRWTGHVARMGRDEVHTSFFVRREREYLEDPSVYGMIISRWNSWIAISIAKSVCFSP
jgi:hypothetical protein